MGKRLKTKALVDPLEAAEKRGAECFALGLIAAPGLDSWVRERLTGR